MGVGDDQLGAVEPARLQAAQEVHPEGLRLRRAEPQADDLAPPVGVGGDGDYRRDADDPPALTDLEIGGVEPDIGPVAGQGPVEELADPLVDVLAELRDRALGDAGQPHRLRQFVDAAGRDAADPGLLDHRHQGLLRGLARLQEAREVAALPELRHLEVQRAQTGIESALSIPVAPGRALIGPLVLAGADQAFDIGLHDQLQNGLGDGAKEVATVLLCQKLGKVHVGLGHRGLRVVRG